MGVVVKIRHIRIQNLRAIDSLDLDLVPLDGEPLDTVVLAGPNGCGKTSVLEACLWALKEDSLVPRPLPDQPFLIRLDVEHEGERYRIERTPIAHQILDGASRPRPVTKWPPWFPVRPLYFSSWRAPRLIGSVGLSMSQPKRGPAPKQGDALARLKQYLVNLQATSAFGRSATADFPSATTVFERIADLWRELYPAGGGRFEAIVVDHPDASEDGSPKAESGELGPMYDLVLTDRQHPHGIPVDELSSGEIEALSMIGTFAMNRAGFDLVLIDEPELHLHPAWHRAIMRVLRRAAPKAQIICATHSEHILDAVYGHQRFTLLRESDPRIRLASGG